MDRIIDTSLNIGIIGDSMIYISHIDMDKDIDSYISIILDPYISDFNISDGNTLIISIIIDPFILILWDLSLYFFIILSSILKIE
jgi:hypothetical protein